MLSVARSVIRIVIVVARRFGRSFMIGILARGIAAILIHRVGMILIGLVIGGCSISGDVTFDLIRDHWFFTYGASSTGTSADFTCDFCDEHMSRHAYLNTGGGLSGVT